MKAARDDERIRALLVWGPLARGSADEWSAVELVACVLDESVPDVIEELSAKDSLYGQALVTLPLPQDGVDGGGYLRVTYLQSGLPLQVDWYVCPVSLGIPVGDTKPLFTREGWPESGASFAEFLRQWPSRQSFVPAASDLLVSTIAAQVKEVARGRPEVVLVDGRPMVDRISAFDELGWRIADLPAGSGSDVRAALFYYLGLARRGR